MIKGKKKVDLTQESILKRISEYDVYKFYMVGNWKPNHVTHSPFREDPTPSFLISNKYGNLGYIDFGDSRFRGDCFNFVKQMFDFPTLDTTLKKIDKDFGLGISSGIISSDYKKIISAYKQPESAGKRYVKIQVQPKRFTKEDLAYWNMFHQGIDDLKQEHVYSIKKIFLNKKRFSFKENELTFGYYYDGFWKLYRPYENKKRKWLPNNVPITTMDGRKNLVKDKGAFILGSKKDYMVMKKVYPSACATQNEGVACFSVENVDFIKENSSHQILGYDSDIAGVKSSQEITKMFGFDYCNVPRKFLAEGINDWAGLAEKHGMKPIENYLTEKLII